MKPHLHDLTQDEFLDLRAKGLLWELYPHATCTWSDLENPTIIGTPVLPGENFAATMEKLNMAQPQGPTDKNQSKVQPTTILDDAAKCIFGDRNTDYGSPTSDFACSAAMMSAYINRRFGVNIQLEPRDIGPLMILVKVSRMAHKPKADNAIDIAGYAACTDWVIKEMGGY